VQEREEEQALFEDGLRSWIQLNQRGLTWLWWGMQRRALLDGGLYSWL
jgi:hypothetical protein